MKILSCQCAQCRDQREEMEAEQVAKVPGEFPSWKLGFDLQPERLK